MNEKTTYYILTFDVDEVSKNKIINFKNTMKNIKRISGKKKN